ncbi:MAG TPA: hypothetical protein VGQ59_21185 [Cyclobacteriaceae bacterium]|jgi:hypothetical protein|nr:hypothetical protein [Cyclobacteriaceae bacterium]
MPQTKNSIAILVLMGIVGGCFKPDNSITPQIQFQSVEFKHGSPTSADVLTISINFKDGDGDLGINGDETEIAVSPAESKDISTPIYYYYQLSQSAIWYPTHKSNETLKNGYEYVNYASYRKIHSSPFDTLPALTCKNWELRQTPADTLYIQQNPYANNIFVYLYTKSQNGSYTYFDPTNLYSFGDRCVNNFFHGRFQVLSLNLGKKSPLEGTITYNIQSSALYSLLNGKTAKLKIYILDRAFHKSNLVESADFVIR